MLGISTAIKKTAKRLDAVLTRELISYALADGWDTDVANALKVTYQNKQYKFSVADGVKDRALAYEYGDGTNPPKGTVRKFGNLNDKAGKDFVLLFSQGVGK